ncbi:MAG: type II toxin-antitoxin system RelE/ParE family toxin [Candidatus Binatia bacterium]
MIVSFGDKVTEALYHGEPPKLVAGLPPEIREADLRKLDVLEAAQTLSDLRSPPGNRLEALRGALRGFHSIRINDQWRLVFRWAGSDAHDVRITDYH